MNILNKKIKVTKKVNRLEVNIKTKNGSIETLIVDDTLHLNKNQLQTRRAASLIFAKTISKDPYFIHSIRNKKGGFIGVDDIIKIFSIKKIVVEKEFLLNKNLITRNLSW